MGNEMDVLFENYKKLLQKIDRFCDDSVGAYGNDLVCRKGCSSCCRHLSLFPVEAMHIRFAIDGLDDEIIEIIRKKAVDLIDEPDGECPLLDEGLCLLYQVRPIICRTHGLPVLVRSDQGTAVDYCPLNFTSGRKPDSKHILDIEQVNTTLVTVNGLFVRAAFDEGELPERFLLSEALLLDFE